MNMSRPTHNKSSDHLVISAGVFEGILFGFVVGFLAIVFWIFHVLVDIDIEPWAVLVFLAPFTISVLVVYLIYRYRAARYNQPKYAR
jgi:hypothetical protein